MIIACALIGAVSVISWLGPKWWGYFLYTRQVRALQRECLAYTASVDSIVYDTDPADRQKLLALSAEYRAFNDWAVFHVPPAWHDFRGSYDCPDGTAYVHARTSPGGYKRLVAVDIIPIRKDAVELRASVVDLAPRFDLQKLESCRRSMGKPGNEWASPAGSSIRIYAGQPDSSDESRFVIPIDLGKGVSLIHCQLQDDNTIIIDYPQQTEPFAQLLPLQK